MKSAVFSAFVILSFCLVLLGCKDQPAEIPVTVRRLEKELFAAKSPAEVAVLLQKSPYLRAYFGISKDAPDSLIVGQLYRNISNPDLKQFNEELQHQFGDLTSLKTLLQQAFGQIKAAYPDFKTPQIVTAVTGFMGSDLYVSDSVIVIGLDYFGGPKAGYRPQLHDYQLRRYQQEYIVPAILFFISQKYNKVPTNDQTFLADMIWYGKGFEFIKHVAPETPDSLIIGYSQAQLDDVYASQQDIWAYFLDRQLLYQTRDAEKERFIGERPATVEISQYCPGGIGRWVGWRIISRYLQEKPNTSLVELMANTNVRQLLEDSKYKGQKEEE
ncbi:MAG: gliding motility protein [Spirosomataceae bacterium]